MKGFRRLERRHLRRRDGDRLPSSGIASLTCGAASDGELPEPRNGAIGSSRASAAAIAIDGVKWPQNGQVENVPFAGRRRVCTKALGREEDVNSMISRRRCVEE